VGVLSEVFVRHFSSSSKQIAFLCRKPVFVDQMYDEESRTLVFLYRISLTHVEVCPENAVRTCVDPMKSIVTEDDEETVEQ
jgi:hypothetical protein